jgi:hypothetical protein
VSLGSEEVEELLADLGAFHELAALTAMNSKPTILKEKPARRRVSSGWTASTPAGSMVVDAVVVVVVLAIALLTVNAISLHILGVIEPMPLLTRDDTVRPGFRLHALYVRLPVLEAHRLVPGEATRSDPLLDARLLGDLALIDARGALLRHGQKGQTQADDDSSPDAIHFRLLFVGRIP